MRIDPRFRQRRIEVKRQEGRRRLRALIAVAAVAATLVAGFVAARSPLLAVRHVRISGATRTPIPTLIATAGLRHKPNMFDVHTGAEAAAIRRLAWIDQVHVRRQWPATITITVIERTPAAVMGPPAAEVQVDATGRVLGPAPAGTTLPLVVTDGDPQAGHPPSDPAPLPAGPMPPPPAASVAAVYRPGLEVAKGLTPGLAPRIMAIVVTARGGVDLRLFGGAWAVLGTPDDLGEKLQAVQTLLDSAKVGKGVIDVTVGSAPVIRATG